jgi:hypothetical protein
MEGQTFLLKGQYWILFYHSDNEQTTRKESIEIDLHARDITAGENPIPVRTQSQ